jgi:hypothetical protein
MRRREFISLLRGAVLWPRSAHARQAVMPVIGFVNVASPQGYARPLSAFLKGLGETAYVEGSQRRDRIPLGGGQMNGCLRWWPIWFIVGSP